MTQYKKGFLVEYTSIQRNEQKIFNAHECIYLFDLWVITTWNTKMLLIENTGLFSLCTTEYRFYYYINLIHIDKPIDTLKILKKLNVLGVE